MNSSLGGSIILILILILINAFFVATEMSIVSINKSRLRILVDADNKKAILLQKLLEEPSKFLATIQVGITLAGFFTSASAATSLSNYLTNVLISYNIPYSPQISVIIITIVVSYITLVLGELFPKRIALKQSERVAMFVVKPIYSISKLTIPFVKLLSGSTNILLRAVGIKTDDIEEKISEEEIRSLIEVGKEHGVINETEREMINSIFKFDDKLAKEVMTPRTEVFMLPLEEELRNVIKEIVSEKFSRIPIYKEDIDNIVGILYTKDLFAEVINKGMENITIPELLRKPYFIPETKHIDDLFKELKDTKSHMAILIDEYGGFSGIVTIEDLIEEVMGDISDEYDEDGPGIKRIDNETFIVDGLVSLDEVNYALNLELESEYSDTIGGFVVSLLGSLPRENEDRIIKYDNVTFKIEKVDEKRIEKVKIYIQEQ